MEKQLWNRCDICDMWERNNKTIDYGNIYHCFECDEEQRNNDPSDKNHVYIACNPHNNSGRYWRFSHLICEYCATMIQRGHLCDYCQSKNTNL